MRIPLYIVRALQLVFSVVVLGLSAHVAEVFGDAQHLCSELGRDNCDPSIGNAFGTNKVGYSYAAFTGAWGIIEVLIGLVAMFVSAIPMVVVLVIDAMAAIFYVAAGGRLADLLSNDGDCDGTSLCHQAEAACAFAWLGFIAALILLGLEFFRSRKEGKGMMHSSV